MLKVTVDTNIYISAFEFRGLPRRFLNEALAGRFQLMLSDAIQSELHRVLGKKFQWSQKDIKDALQELSGCTTYIKPLLKLNAVPADPDDNRVIECAVESGSHFIVTGDNDLLCLGSYNGIPILKVIDFLNFIA